MPIPRLRPGLMTHPLDDQLLVYDAQSDAVHLLDKTTAFVFDLLRREGCTREEIRAELSERLGTHDSEPLLVLALADIEACGLLEVKAVPTPISAMDRRNALKKVASIGLATSLIPAVVTLIPSTGYAQASGPGVAFGGDCSGGANCTPPNVCQDNSTGNGTAPFRCCSAGATNGNALAADGTQSASVSAGVFTCGGGANATARAAYISSRCCSGSGTQASCSSSAGTTNITWTCSA